MKNSLALRAYAKINLSLDVIRKREDSYHDIDSIMQGIDLYDDIEVELSDFSDAAEFQPLVEAGKAVNGPSSTRVILSMQEEGMPPCEKNLAVRAALLFLEAIKDDCDIEKKEIRISIDKKLPVAAGIAGGSGNAATVLIALNELFETPFDMRELMQLGAGLGADVPFSAMMNIAKNRAILSLKGREEAGVSANTSGIGDIIEVRESIHRYVVLANPGVRVSTAEVYEAMDLLPEEERRVLGIWHNMMEKYTLEVYGEARELKYEMEKLGAEHVLMSGSGPSIVAYFTTEDAARKASWELERIASDRSRDWMIKLTETGREF